MPRSNFSRAPLLSRVTRALFALLLVSVIAPPDADARRGRRRRAPAPAPPAIDAATLELVRPLLDRLATRSDEGAKLAVFEARLLMTEEDQGTALDAALAASDMELKLRAARWLLQDKARAGARYETAIGFLKELLGAGDAAKRAHGYALLDEFFPATAAEPAPRLPRHCMHVLASERAARRCARLRRRLRRRRGAESLSRLSLIQEIARIGHPEARQAARVQLFARRDEIAWALVEQGLGAEGQPIYSEALAALEAYAYPQAQRWAMERIYEDGEEGRIARVWFENVEGVRGLDRQLERLYQQKFGDFPKRVRLASLLARRGKYQLVRETLIHAVGNRRSTNPTIRALGWEGLQYCREQVVLQQFKIFFLAISNEEENRPAAVWLREWFKETGEPLAMEILQEMARSNRYATRSAALRVLGELQHRESIPLIAGILREGDLPLRQSAAGAISAMIRPGDERDFQRYLRQERRDVGIRVKLIEALGTLGTREALNVLRFYLPERNAALRRAAIEAVAQVEGGDIAVLLPERLRLDPDRQIRLRVWELLLTRAPERLARSMRSAAVWLTPAMVEHLSGLAAVPATFFAEVAINAPTQTRALRQAAVDALHRRGEAGLVSLNRVINQQPGDYVNGSAVDRVGVQLKEQALGTYRRLLERREAPLRAAAYRNIGLYGPFAQLERMKQGYEDDEPLVRAEAIRAVLGLLRRQAAASP